MLKIALSHDIDRIDKSYQRITHSIKSIMKMDFKSVVFHLFSRNTYWGFDEIIHIESKYNVRSTHFFLNESIKLNLLKKPTYKLSLGRYSIYDNRIKEVILFFRQKWMGNWVAWFL